jgi:hypothetical protein
MKLHEYFYSKSVAERNQFADAIDYSHSYVQIHLIPKNSPPDRLPPLPKLRLISKATSGVVSFEEVLEHFEQIESAA